jgi:hypothetical protein
MWFDDAHGARTGSSSQGAPRRAHRRSVTVVRGGRCLPAVHEQAMRRLTEVTGLIPVEYPTTRTVGAAPRARAADINAAFADPAIRAILAVIGGEDQITVIPTWTPNWPGVIPSRSWA